MIVQHSGFLSWFVFVELSALSTRVVAEQLTVQVLHPDLQDLAYSWYCAVLH